MVHNKDDWLLELPIAPKSKADAEKLAVALAELAAEDPSLGVHTDAESGRTILKGMGELHLYAKIDVLRRTYDVEVERGRPRVAYRETITRPVGHSYTHKKQTGGSGEFAMVAFDVRPNPADAGNTFQSVIAGGDMPIAYTGGVAKGVDAALAAGPLGGFPVVDVAVALVDGRYHDVDSSALAFERAARAGLGEALKMAAPVIKEPIMKVAVVTPEDYLGSVMGDLSSRRGSIVGTDTRGNAQVIDALVPLANLFGYAHTLRALSRARATFTMRFDHYEVMPRGLGDGPPFRPAAIMRG